MGIRNLLEYIKPLFKKRNISDFEGKRLGIDVMCGYISQYMVII